KAFLFRYIRKYMGSDGRLHFDKRFHQADTLIQMFLDTPVHTRRQLANGQGSNILDSKVATIYKNMLNPNRDSRMTNLKECVCDYQSAAELHDVFRAFGGRCMVTGIKLNKVTPSIDKLTTADSRYNWTDIIPINFRVNDAKVSAKYIFESCETVQAYLDEHPELGQLPTHKLAVQVMRRWFCALLENYYSWVMDGEGAVEKGIEEIDIEMDDLEDMYIS
ncbi:hypothetical protein HK102_010862, partial [Quaeritorhiza haematococci]